MKPLPVSVLCVATLASVRAFVPAIDRNGMVHSSPITLVVDNGDAKNPVRCPARRLPLLQMTSNGKHNNDLTDEERKSILSLLVMTPVVVGLFASLPVNAADGGGDNFFPIASALAAYAHFAGLFCTVACLAAERVILSCDNFSEKDEDLLTKVDAAYGLFGIPVFVSGYFRVTQYGKGFDFYKHEPFFWLKVCILCYFAYMKSSFQVVCSNMLSHKLVP